MVNRSTVKKTKTRSGKSPSQVRRRSSKGKGSKKKSRTGRKRQSRRKSRNSVMKGGAAGVLTETIFGAANVATLRSLTLHAILNSEQIILLSLASSNLCGTAGGAAGGVGAPHQPGAAGVAGANDYQFNDVIEYINNVGVAIGGAGVGQLVAAVAAAPVVPANVRTAVDNITNVAMTQGTDRVDGNNHVNLLHFCFQRRAVAPLPPLVVGVVVCYWMSVIKYANDRFVIAAINSRTDDVLPSGANLAGTTAEAELPVLNISIPTVTFA